MLVTPGSERVNNTKCQQLTETNLHFKLPNFLFPQSQRKFLKKIKVNLIHVGTCMLILKCTCMIKFSTIINYMYSCSYSTAQG